MPITLKTKLKNLTKEPLFLRWVAPRGASLNPGEELVVEGAYPSVIKKGHLVKSCEFDIEHGRIEATIITNIPTGSVPTAAKAAVCKGNCGKATVETSTPFVTPIVDQDEKVHSPDGMVTSGTIESRKPAAITLSGHEDVLNDKEEGPVTLDIFKDGPSVEPPGTVELVADKNEKAEKIKADKVAAELAAEAPKDSTKKTTRKKASS